MNTGGNAQAEVQSLRAENSALAAAKFETEQRATQQQLRLASLEQRVSEEKRAWESGVQPQQLERLPQQLERLPLLAQQDGRLGV